jgi:hypothetical protein
MSNVFNNTFEGDQRFLTAFERLAAALELIAQSCCTTFGTGSTVSTNDLQQPEHERHCRASSGTVCRPNRRPSDAAV